jgi:hypothetical protein
MKTCICCDLQKDPTDFYIHPEMADGRLNKCKVCCKNQSASRRSSKLETIREYDRDRAKSPKRMKHNSDNTSRWRKENPEKWAAQILVNNYLRDGKLIKKSCEVCGSEKVHGHHDDYSKPLEVIWLCAEHHKQRHKWLDKQKTDIQYHNMTLR